MVHTSDKTVLIIIPYYNFFNSNDRATNIQIACNYLKHQIPDNVKVLILEAGETLKDPVFPTLQINCKDLIWQKETLINIGFQQFASFDVIIWMDGDMVFLNNDWVERTLEKLETHDVVQCFRVGYINGAFKLSAVRDNEIHGGFPGQCQGGIWAANTPIDFGLYPYNIVGGGDTIFAWSIMGLSMHTWERFTEVYPNDSYASSARDYIKQIKGLKKRVASVNNIITALNHGEVKNRKYRERHHIMDLFDPNTDVTYNDNGLLEWADAGEVFKKRYMTLMQGRES
jgi:hypothetical protein